MYSVNDNVFFIILVFLSLLQFDSDDERGKDLAKLIDLIHDCFHFDQTSENDDLNFETSIRNFDLEVVDCCRGCYRLLKITQEPKVSLAIYWLAAVHAVLSEPLHNWQRLLNTSSSFRKSAFAAIEERNQLYFYYICHSYAAANPIDINALSLKLKFVESCFISND